MTLLGMGAAALAFTVPSSPDKRIRRPLPGFQLYSVREQIATDLEGTMRTLAEIGYVGVETYALPEGLTLRGAAKVFKDCGLNVFGMHTELPEESQRENILKMADAYQCDRVVYAGWPEGEKYKNMDAIRKTAEMYDEIAVYLKSRGLRFGLHNHWFEFELVDNVYPFYYLLEHASPAIFFEIDTYWAKTAGLDPARVLRDFGKRAPFLHIKDGPAIKGDQAYVQVPAGKGAMDFPAIAAAGQENTEWMIVEFDEYAGDIFEGLKSSYGYLASKGFIQAKE